MKTSLARKVNIGFAAALLVIFTMGVMGFFTTSKTVAIGLQRDRLAARTMEIEKLLSLLKDAETSQRGFIITNDEKYLVNYRNSEREIPQQFEELYERFEGEPENLEKISEVEALSNLKFGEMNETILLRRKNDFEKARQIISTNRGLSYMQESISIIEGLKKNQQVLFRNLVTKSESYTQASAFFMIAGSMSAFLIVAVGTMLMNNDRRRRDQITKNLKAAEEKAREAVQAKSEFLANMSHEIRTPLNGVIGMTDLLMESQLDERQKQLANIVSESGAALLHLINDILDYSKIEAGKLDFEHIDFHLISMIETESDIVAARATEKGLSLMTYVDPALPLAHRGDPGRIGQVILNLLSNAIKFTEAPGEIILRVSQNQANGHVRFEIEDTGIGISDAVRERLFHAFTQADSSTSRKFGGTGLGLSICKRLVELMHGQIGVESELGRGSRFWFEIPLEVSEMSFAPTADPIALAGLKDLKIMVIDDDKFVCEVICQYSQNWGMQTIVAANGEQGLEILRREAQTGKPVELVFIDKLLPRMDGYEVLQKIQADELIQKTKIKTVLITSFDRRSEEKGAMQAGFHDFLAKPLRQSQIFDCIAGLQEAEVGKIEIQIEHDSEFLSQSGASNARSLILVAEDNHVNQLLISMQLESLGYLVHMVANGKEALEALGRIEYDLVFMDCQMPEMDGYEATRFIRLNEIQKKRRRVPVIALTANAMQGDAENCISAGMDDYLSKPAKKARLVELLGKWLPNEKSEHQKVS